MAEGEVAKLQNHLSLLREEYVKLQNRLAEVEKKYQIASASAGQVGNDNFVARLLKTVADLFDKELYSDLQIQLDGSKQVFGHRFVLAARSDYWGVPDLSQVSSLDFSNIKYEVAHALLRWAYTDDIDIRSDSDFLLELLRAATKFKLRTLQERCENGLMSFVNMKNCITFYQTAEEIGADLLKRHCSTLISNHWNDFTSEDFVHMPAPLLYQMFKAKTEYPLHATIRAKREDALFLYLIEYDSQLSVKLNDVDDKGDLPMDLALQSRQTSIAETLMKHRVDVNRRDNTGKCLLHKAIKRGDEFSAEFLIRNGADVTMTTHLDRESPLHMVATFNPDVTSPDVITGMACIAKQLLEHNADPNHQDTSGSTALHAAVFSKNVAVFQTLLDSGKIHFELKTSDGHTALWLALQQGEDKEGDVQTVYGPQSFAAQLLAKGSSPDAVEPETGDTILHLATRSGNERAGIFLASHGAKVNLSNSKGENPLHLACQKGLSNLVQVLLSKGGNPNGQTRKSTMSDLMLGQDEAPATLQTPLHLALVNKYSEIVEIFLQHKVEAAHSEDNVLILPNFNLKDSDGQTVLGLALWSGLHSEADRLLGAGANINEKNADGFSLLHQAIEKQDTTSAMFLIEHQADLNMKYVEDFFGTNSLETPLQHAIQRHLPVVVDMLCKRGVNMNLLDHEKSCPLWQALDTGQEDIAQILVKHGCDLDLWSEGPSSCEQTLLHRAVDENNEAVACFLIKSGCDKNATRRPGPNGEGEDEAKDQQTPLHMACTWGLEIVVQCLMEHSADVNAQDTEGKTPIHIAIENQHPVIISLLLSHPSLDLTVRDKQGFTPFAAAMTTKNNKAAQAILNRESTAAEQVDNRGRNFLHTAIQKSDIESVLFLISVHANVNSRVQDSQQLTPLHLAVTAGSEIIVRNLLLAGADVNAKTKKNETSLHLAALKDHSVIASILLENGIDYDVVDENLNNALHVAVQHGNLNTVRILLTESRVNAEAVNAKGQMAIHVLAQYGRDTASAVFELFKESMPDYPIDRQDAEGNTALLLAYVNGNGSLCRSLVRSGARLGTMNKQGLSIFNAPVATKQLLFKLLDMLSKEPPWSEGEVCLECMVKFSIKTRKHHCRHCGRLVCAKCSAKDMPIVKYNLSKPVRVCDICFDVLSLGGTF
ncbi:rabankyrin-5-like isoform X1 [Mizuhopecten yessoensis]|uniref:rabankyrin-5-like isoform X1 n=1 Tax=Mizuhopecten yessoensis TaxID=6573 RepID=UPI000B45E6F5|nr:rabankyrin-5-like isoform X1 [Mizuhopecten yessoensis]